MKSIKEQLQDAHENDDIILTIRLAEQLLDDGDNRSWIYRVYGESLTGIGRYDDAMMAFEKAEELSIDKVRPWIVCLKGDLERQRGNFDAAIEYYNVAREIMPDDAAPRIFAASLLFRMGKLKDAEELAVSATKCKDGSRSEAWHNLGGYLAAQERYSESLYCYECALEIDPEYELAHKRKNEINRAFPNLNKSIYSGFRGR